MSCENNIAVTRSGKRSKRSSDQIALQEGQEFLRRTNFSLGDIGPYNSENEDEKEISENTSAAAVPRKLMFCTFLGLAIMLIVIFCFYYITYIRN